MNHDEALATFASERYLLDEMTAPERDAFETHYFDCASCAEDVTLGAAMQAGAKSYFAARPRAAWRPSIVLPWAAAAMLAVGVGYQALVVVPSLRHAGAPALVEPVTVRPASRGREAVVASSAGAPVVLAVEITLSAAAGEIEYDVIGPGARAIASGRAPLPPAGAPLFLVLPAQPLAGEYVLRLRGGPDREAAEYRFIVK